MITLDVLNGAVLIAILVWRAPPVSVQASERSAA
jgi:hypothetical protein